MDFSLPPGCLRSLKRTFVAGILAAISSHPLWSAEIIDLGSLGGNSSQANAINEAGQVVGWAATRTGPDPFLYSNGHMTDLGRLSGGESAAAIAINNSGQIVGTAGFTFPGGDTTEAFLYNGGHMVGLGTLAGPANDSNNSVAYGINDSGQVVGRSSGFNSVNGFLYQNGQMTTFLPASLNNGSVANAINNTGQIVGDYPRGYVDTNGRIRWLGPTLGTNVYPTAINNSGEVVGYVLAGINGGAAFFNTPGHMTIVNAPGFIYTWAVAVNNEGVAVGYGTPASGYGNDALEFVDGNVIDLNSLLPANSGWQLFSASGINDSGQIAGTGWYHGQELAFLLDTATTPEPTPLALLGFGIVLLGLMRRLT